MRQPSPRGIALILILSVLLAALSACASPDAATTEEEAATPTERRATPSPRPTERDAEDVEAESATEPATPAITSPDDWQEMPIVPVVSDTAREIYQRGQAMGRDPNAFSIIGDCQNVSSHFLGDFDNPEDYSLGDDYAYLQDTIDHFAGSFSADRAAVNGGYNVATFVSTLRTNLAYCEYGETPIECEYRRTNPSIAIISIETNFAERDADYFADYLRQIIEYTIDAGVVPIMATKADNLEGDNSINRAIVGVALEYDVPLWNFWASVQDLPDGGLTDGFHLSYGRPFFDDPDRMQYAWPHRNLTALQALDAVWRGVSEQAPTPVAAE